MVATIIAAMVATVDHVQKNPASKSLANLADRARDLAASIKERRTATDLPPTEKPTMQDSTPPGAKVWKWKDSTGKTHFTDTPPPGGAATLQTYVSKP